MDEFSRAYANTLFFLFFLGFESTQLARRKQPKHTQIDRKKPPPPAGGFYLLCSLIMSRVYRFHDEMRPSYLVVKSITHGS